MLKQTHLHPLLSCKTICIKLANQHIQDLLLDHPPLTTEVPSSTSRSATFAGDAQLQGFAVTECNITAYEECYSQRCAFSVAVWSPHNPSNEIVGAKGLVVVPAVLCWDLFVELQSKHACHQVCLFVSSRCACPLEPHTSPPEAYPPVLSQ